MRRRSLSGILGIQSYGTVFTGLRAMFCSLALVLAMPAHGGEPVAAKWPQSPGEHFIMSNTVWTMLHELAHALIHELDLPIFGHEEDAADQIATITFLHAATDLGVPDIVEETQALMAVARAWRVEWELGKRDHRQVAYWDTHSLVIQRFYNVLCLIYGSSPEQYEEVDKELGLPYERAFSCADYEHEQAHHAVKRSLEIYRMEYGETAGRGVVSVVYETPMDSRHRELVDFLRRFGVTELVAFHVTRQELFPDDIRVVFAPCYGQESAYWQQHSGEVVMCYELVEHFAFLYAAQGCFGVEDMSDDEVNQCLARARDDE